MPNIGITGLSGLGEESDAPFINDDTTIQIVDNFSWTVGTHAVQVRRRAAPRADYDQIGGVVTRGRLGFDGRYTQNPLLPAAQRGGAAFADFLLGPLQPIRRPGRRADRQLPLELLRALRAGQLEARPTPSRSTTGCAGSTTSRSTTQNDAIVNIDFRGTTPRAGVRAAGTGDPYEGDPAFRLAPDVQYVRDGRFGRGAYQQRLQRFRAAARHRLERSRRKPSCGPAAASTTCATSATPSSTPCATPRSRSAATSRPRRFRPNLSFQQPFARTGAPTFILANQCDEPSSYVAQWSLGVQRELTGNMTVEATYFGSAGVHLRRLMSYNNPEPSQLANSNNARPFPEVRQHSGDERAGPFELPRAAISRCSGASRRASAS